jgi:hypothetical protein
VDGPGFAAYRRQPLRLAVLAAFRLVLELFVVEEKLLTRSEDEILSAVNAL